jgi:hypothetical protein
MIDTALEFGQKVARARKALGIRLPELATQHGGARTAAKAAALVLADIAGDPE